MRKLRILVVDDNLPNLEMLNVMLTSAGHTAFPVPSARQAVDLARELRPDVVMMGMVAPGKHVGLEAARQIKSDPVFSGILIIHTACASVAEQQRGLATGADAYLIAPFKRRDLLALIDRLVEQRTPSR